MIHLQQFTFNLFEERCSVVWDDDRKCAIIDPGAEREEEKEQLARFISKEGLQVQAILLTHAHFDHIYGLMDAVRRYNVPVYMHPNEEKTLATNDELCRKFGISIPERPMETIRANADDHIHIGSLDFEVIATPGHTPGGVSYLERKEKALFCGDTLFAGAIGRSDFPGGDYDELMESIMIGLMQLDGDINIYPGHGPNTDIATERTTNPFLFPFNEPYEDPDEEENDEEDTKE